MADFEYVSINTTAEKIERIANMDIDDVTLDENSTDNSLPTSKLVFDTIKNEVENKIDQTYNPESENAQSGKAVAAAANGRVPKIADNTSGAPFDNVLMQRNRPALGQDLSDDLYFITGSDVESIDPQPYFIARRDSNGNIKSNTPIKNLDCANKKYVDDAVANAGGGGSVDLSNYYTKAEIDKIVGDIETLLGGI